MSKRKQQRIRNERIKATLLILSALLLGALGYIMVVV
jgi:hypothetical protein